MQPSELYKHLLVLQTWLDPNMFPGSDPTGFFLLGTDIDLGEVAQV